MYCVVAVWFLLNITPVEGVFTKRARKIENIEINLKIMLHRHQKFHFQTKRVWGLGSVYDTRRRAGGQGQGPSPSRIQKKIPHPRTAAKKFKKFKFQNFSKKNE